jgi:hypothetical protein
VISWGACFWLILHNTWQNQLTSGTIYFAHDFRFFSPLWRAGHGKVVQLTPRWPWITERPCVVTASLLILGSFSWLLFYIIHYCWLERLLILHNKSFLNSFIRCNRYFIECSEFSMYKVVSSAHNVILNSFLHKWPLLLSFALNKLTWLCLIKVVEVESLGVPNVRENIFNSFPWNMLSVTLL